MKTTKIIGTGSCAVSYTHLDVYKRQEEGVRVYDITLKRPFLVCSLGIEGDRNPW